MAFSKAKKTCPIELRTLRESCGPQREVRGEDNNNEGNVSVHIRLRNMCHYATKTYTLNEIAREKYHAS